MNYLIEKTSLTIEPALAVSLGLNEAIFIKQLHYWLRKTKHKKSDKKWVFNTMVQWQEQMPFFSLKTIQRIIQNLKKDKWIFVEKLDKNKLNKTNWYSINYEKIHELKEKTKISQIPNPIGKNTTEKLLKKNPNEGVKNEELFDEFWSIYPRKYQKAVVLKIFNKLSEQDKKLAIYSAEKYRDSIDGVENKYIKTPRKWLEEKVYEDYRGKTITQSNNQNNKLNEILANKINNLIEIKKTSENLIYEEKNPNEVGDLFNEAEKNKLKFIGMSLEEYVETEFKKGQILKLLKGY